MGLVVTSLGSGSSGNALLVQAGQAALLIDCGLPQRSIENQLRRQGLVASDLQAVLLTHEHGDHAHSAGGLARRHGVPVVCNSPTRAALDGQLAGCSVEELPIGERASIGPFDITSFELAHDAAAPVGYRVTTDGATIGLAIDLGSWDVALAAALAQADLLIVEANHDRELLRASVYPWALQQRISGPRGHLDNVQTGELLAQISADGRPRDIWLAHLSEQANSPQRAIQGVQRVLKLAGVSVPQLAALPRQTAAARRGAAVWSSDRLLRQRELF